jgi:hypothetical protein
VAQTAARGIFVGAEVKGTDVSDRVQVEEAVLGYAMQLEGGLAEEEWLAEVSQAKTYVDRVSAGLFEDFGKVAA